MKTSNFAATMKHLKNVFVICLFLTGPTSSGQYVKLVKGEPSPFDTAVAIQIDRYRQEGLKLKMGGQLVDSLLAEIKSLGRETSVDDSLHLANAKTIEVLVNQVARKDSVNQAVNNNFNELVQQATKPKKFYQHPVLIGAATFIGLEVMRLIFK